jgi:hypothetical protein
MWSTVTESDGLNREHQLREEFWKPMMAQGSSTRQYHNTYDSAWDIVERLVRGGTLQPIQIQRELVDLGKRLPETAAGRALRNALQEHAKQEQAIAQSILLEGTPEAKARYDRLLESLNPTLVQIGELKIPLSRRLKRFFKFTRKT